MLRHGWNVFSLGSLLVGCGDPTLAFPEGLEPLDPVNLASLPEGSPDDPYPEEANVVLSQGEGYGVAHLAGYLHASAREAWAALQVPEVLVDRREVDAWEVTELPPDGVYDVLLDVQNVVYDVITVTYDETWGFGDVSEDQGVWAARWAKTGGSTVIALLEGSAVLADVADGVATVELMQHLDALQVDPAATSAARLRDMFDDLVACVHGDPLPEYP